jgi:hypothetical protein
MLSNGITQEELKNQGNWNGTDVIDQHYNHAKLLQAKQAAEKIAEVMKKVSANDTTHSQRP